MNQFSNLKVKAESVTEILVALQFAKGVFKNKIALITGGARGFGKELVMGLASLGTKVYFIDCLREKGKAVEKEVRQSGYEAYFINEDITNFDAIEKCIQQIIIENKTIHFLINNAVKFITKSIEDLSIEEWQYAHSTNSTAPLFLSKCVLPKMKEHKLGMIVNLIAVEGMAFASSMSSSKASCRSLTISLAAEVEKENNVTVLGYAPGLMDTPLVFENFPNYCNKLNYDFSDYVLNITNNPGYKGLIPASHSAASLIWYMSKGRENHGLICTPYLPLHEAGLINIKDEYIQQDIDKRDNINKANQYIIEIDKYQKEIENKIEFRTKQLELEKTKTAKLLSDVQKHSRELEILNNEKGNLLKEIHHRVKNNMQIISSLLRIQSNLAKENATVQLLEQSQNRIVAMSTVHDILYKSNNYSAIQYENYLEQLCHYLHTSMKISSCDVHFKVDAKKIKLNLDTSISLGLIINEILTNSLKHAFTNRKEGEIYIEFCEPDEFQYMLKIGDNGIGINERNPTNPDGLGCQLIYDLAEQLNGKIEPSPNEKKGTHYLIYFNELKSGTIPRQ